MMTEQIQQTEERQGTTGILTFLFKTDDHYFMVINSLGTRYKLTPAEWFELPLIE